MKKYIVLVDGNNHPLHRKQIDFSSPPANALISGGRQLLIEEAIKTMTLDIHYAFKIQNYKCYMMRPSLKQVHHKYSQSSHYSDFAKKYIVV